jgi:hypothetical protein
MRPAPAVRQPHANQLSISHPVDMHAHAIIIAPMTNTKSEPVANLRSQGMLKVGVVGSPTLLTGLHHTVISENEISKSGMRWQAHSSIYTSAAAEMLAVIALTRSDRRVRPTSSDYRPSFL